MKPDFTDDVGDFLWREFTAYRRETPVEEEKKPGCFLDILEDLFSDPVAVDSFFFDPETTDD